jgi:hypothetical protein
VSVNIPRSTVSPVVANAIDYASARTGVDRQYLWQQARIESGFDPAAKANTSSARGLYQFTEQTWLRTLKTHGEKHGLGEWSAQITQQPSGYCTVASGQRSAVLELRDNPTVAALMAGALATDNGNSLAATTGRKPSAVDLYMGHFLGARGAGRFLKTVNDAPDMPAAQLLPDAARANRTIFFNKNGSARTVQDVYQHFAAKFGVQNQPAADTLTQIAARQPASPLPGTALRDQAQLAYLMLADLGAA